MSLRKSIKRVGKKVQAAAKNVGRISQVVVSKVVKPVTAVGAGIVGYTFGPAAGAAVAGFGAGVARVTGATAARRRGIIGKEARTKGRKLAQQTFKYGLITTGVGTGIAGGVAALTGGNVLGALTGGSQNLFGIGGGGGGNVDTMPDIPADEAAYMQANIPGSGATYPGSGGTYSVTSPGSGAPTDWGSVLGSGFQAAGSVLAPKPGSTATTPDGGGIGDILNNLFSSAPGEGVQVPLLGELPMGIVLIGGGLILWMVAKK